MKKAVVSLIAVSLLIAITLPATAFEVKNVTVIPSNNGILVKVNYSLDPITALKVFLFGAKTIENDVLSIFNTTENFTIIRIGYSSAEFLFPAEKCENLTYFLGVNLSVPVNLSIYSNAGSQVNIGCVSKIPPMYFYNNLS